MPLFLGFFLALWLSIIIIKVIEEQQSAAISRLDFWWLNYAFGIWSVEWWWITLRAPVSGRFTPINSTSLVWEPRMMAKWNHLSWSSQCDVGRHFTREKRGSHLVRINPGLWGRRKHVPKRKQKNTYRGGEQCEHKQRHSHVDNVETPRSLPRGPDSVFKNNHLTCALKSVSSLVLFCGPGKPKRHKWTITTRKLSEVLLWPSALFNAVYTKVPRALWWK